MAQIQIKKSVSTGGGSLVGVSVDMPVDLTASLGAAVPTALLGVSEPTLALRLKTEVGRFDPAAKVFVAPSLSVLLGLATSSAPAVIFLDSDLLGGKPFSEYVEQLGAVAPVLVLASVNSQTEVAKLVALGNVEFVGRVGDYIPLAIALIKRRLSGAANSRPHDAPWPRLPANLGEVFRHEINNPLTGILGNAELVLAHREHFSTQEIQRLQTVVDLAVRLRESIRRISNIWEGNPASPDSH